MDNRIYIMALIAALVAFSGCAILMTEDSDALDNGTASMSVAQGGTSAYTWAEASSAMVATSTYDDQPFYTHNFSYGVGTSNGPNDGARVTGLTVTWSSSGLTLAAASSVTTGTYYLSFYDWTSEDDVIEVSFTVSTAGSGSGSGSGNVNYTSPSAVDALTGSVVTYKPTVNVASSTFSSTTVTGKTNATWLTLSNGTLSGTAPSVSSMTTYYYSIKATTPGGQQAVQTVSFNVYPVAQIATSVSTSYDLTQNTAMSEIALAGNVNMTFGKSGNLPAGVTLSNGKISGTPTEFGDFTITLKGFTTAGPSQTATKKVTFHVAEQTMTITSEAPTGIYYSGKNYTYSPTVNLSAGCTWSLTTEYDWLVLNQGVVTGTIPTDISVTSVSFTLTATSAGGQVKSQNITFSVEKTAAFTSVPTAACVVIPVYNYADDGSFSLLGAIGNFIAPLASIFLPGDGGLDAAEATYDNGTAQMKVVQGSTATYTWSEACSAMATTSTFDDQPFSTHEFTIGVGVSYSPDDGASVDGITVTRSATGLTIAASASVSAGLYYISFFDQTTEDDLFTVTFTVVAASGGSSSGSGTTSGGSISGGSTSGGNTSTGGTTGGTTSGGTSGGSTTPAPTASGDDSTTVYSDGTRTFKFVWTGEDAETVVWDFGDGTTGQGFTVFHTYSENGTYTYSCTGVNEHGSDKVTGTIVVDVPLMKHILSQYLWYIVAAIVLIVLIIAFVLYRRKRNASFGGYY